MQFGGLSMLFSAICSLSALASGTPIPLEHTVRILVVGSTSSFHSSSPPFDFQEVVAQLEAVLTKNGVASVVQGHSIYTTQPAYRYSLFQASVWPSPSLASVLQNNWDYIVVLEDPYIHQHLPGIYAEGVLHISKVVAQSSKILLFVPWAPQGTNEKLSEISHRIANGLPNTEAIVSALAWDSLSNKASDGSHPTSEGAFLGACVVYSHIWNSQSQGDTAREVEMASLAYSTVITNAELNHYEGIFEHNNPFRMQSIKKRNLTSIHYGSSSEARILQVFDKLTQSYGLLNRNYKVCRLANNACPGQNFEPFPTDALPVDFNIGRANYEVYKRYDVDASKYKDTFGFAMQDTNTAAWLYTIDRYSSSNGMTTDLDVALAMQLNGEDALVIPIRILHAKLHKLEQQYGNLGPLDSDGWHMSKFLNEASGAYLFTTLLGRCPIGNRPMKKKSTAGKKWLARKIGYETAWRLNYLQARVPGMEIRLANTKVKRLRPYARQKVAIKFRYKPQSKVAVSAFSPDGSVIVRNPQRVFNLKNFRKAQYINFEVALDKTYETAIIQFVTSSDDEAFDMISDEWRFEVYYPESLYVTSYPTRQSTAP